MFAPLRQLFGNKPAAPLPAVPQGTRYYTVGDIHGRLDLFEALIDAIDADDRVASPAEAKFVMLGDLVDRGPDSAGVVRRARAWSESHGAVLLTGNHEEMFLQAFEDISIMRHFLRHGGRETVLSYGLPRAQFDDATFDEIQQLMTEHVPEADVKYLRAARDYLIAGDYVFVHAGIVPDVPIERQKAHHLRWIRDSFLDHSEPHSHVVVHGHTITDGIDHRSNRVGIDTGAYLSGRLTALVLEGTERRTIQAVDTDGTIAIEAGTIAA